MTSIDSIVIQKRPLPLPDGSSDPLFSRKFIKKTARGKVLKVHRERYLRDDIACGSKSCKECADIYQRHPHLPQPCLSAKGITNNTKVTAPHYLVLDTNIILHQMDLLESMLGQADSASSSSSTSSSSTALPSFVDVVILQTVVEEVRHRSLPLYNRLMDIVKDSEHAARMGRSDQTAENRRWWIYSNDFARESAVARRENESPNDRNDRAIRTAVKWYQGHSPLDVVLLSDDADNVARAQSDDIQAMNVRDYVAGMPAADKLSDLISSREAKSSTDKGSGILYPEHLPVGQATAAIKGGLLHQGYFNASAFNFLEATVKVPRYDKPVILIGRDSMNRAIDGDVVAIEMLPEQEWKASADDVLDADSALKNDDAEGEGEGEEDNEAVDDAEAKLDKKEKKEATSSRGERQPTGKVVSIIRRNWRSYVAHVDASSVHSSALGAQSLFATPVDRKVPRIRIRTRQASELIGQKILVALDDWRPTSRYPDGHFVRALGATESQAAEQESLLLEHDVPYRPFSRAILDCLPPEGDTWVVPPKDATHPSWRGRIDLRDENICSIDPPGCQDIDDALHAKQLPNGNVECGVHIADVSHFVAPATPMDAEAASRGTTVYLVDKRIDMLPHLLGTNLCSLRPFVERLAFSVIWEMDPKTAKVVDVRFSKSVIASKAAFTYEAAQLRKDDSSQTDAITTSIRLLNSIALKLKAQRMANGALNLASPEVRIHLDSPEAAGPIDVEQKEMRETNSLVEEFMLLANVTVAEKIYSAYPQTAVLRRHLPPPRTNFEGLQDVLKKRLGFDLNIDSSGALAKSLDTCTDPSNPALNTLVRIMATRCMLSAEYFCSGSVPRDTFGHYGLACGMYTHFTSPIRRYADVLAHRQLAAAIGHTGPGATLHASLADKGNVDGVLDVVNKRHRGGQMAGRASVEFFVGLSIAKRNEAAKQAAAAKGDSKAAAVVAGQDFRLREDAFVIRVFRNGVSVFVNKYGLEGLITLPAKSGVQCDLDSENYTVTIPKELSGLGKDVKLGVFDRCTVAIGVEKDRSTQRKRVRMELVL
ncbi:putative DIS3 3`-5` exoribonuclease required for 3` end formation of 5.8S rRNA [Jaminaea rosea]|uniref:Ribosomal RNA-processing protein 44 n=1 Tax=Jaminaea rosea TaxID=1569628 RepID=A0A316UT19_9BASI|nr:putative DIS3 3`-5` exoribonuclease required for 3` end formation of 5.8S rRNA [Jaminaea rosea]PWN27938.1 putative DIS3 3`-5` exoribonuclease required for 3` end formation of 5.8S rRNA [Jaminaea rosea]